MKFRRIDIVLVVIAVAVLSSIAIGTRNAQMKNPRSVASTNDTGPNGYRALYEVLDRAGVPMQRFGHRIASLGPDVRTLVVTQYDPLSDAGLDSTDQALLKKFVRNGGRLIEVDTGFAGNSDIAPAVGVSQVIKGSNGAIALARNEFTAGVANVSGPIDAIFDFKDAVGTPLIGNPRGIVVTQSAYGKGEVIAVTAPALFANAHLSQGDNVALAYDLLAHHGPVAFDEYVHGYDDDQDMWQVLPAAVKAAVWIVVAIVALALLGANLPFAPAIPAEPPDERDTSAYLTAMGALMRRAHAAHAAIDAFVNDARRRARRSGATPEVARAVAELERIESITEPTDWAVVRAAAIDFNLRKDYQAP